MNEHETSRGIAQAGILDGIVWEELAPDIEYQQAARAPFICCYCFFYGPFLNFPGSGPALGLSGSPCYISVSCHAHDVLQVAHIIPAKNAHVFIRLPLLDISRQVEVSSSATQNGW